MTEDMTRKEATSYVSLEEACHILGITSATGYNWIRKGMLSPAAEAGSSMRFCREEILAMKDQLQNGDGTELRRRRNKKYISGRLLYRNYVSEGCKAKESVQQILRSLPSEEALEEDLLRCILGSAAWQLMRSKALGSCEGKASDMEDFLRGDTAGCSESQIELLKELLPGKKSTASIRQQYPLIFSISFIYEDREDILGFLYLSCREMGHRKTIGAYYTPTDIVRKMIRLGLENEIAPCRLLDPCCGSGNFLLQLPEDFPAEQIYGNDIDLISVQLARINMALRYPGVSAAFWRRHISQKNYLTEYGGSRKFDLILGNPPWGSRWSEEDDVRIRELYADLCSRGRVDSADLFLARSLNLLKKDGRLFFVMPESVLHVKSHEKIRQMMRLQVSPDYLEYAGESFRGVQCPCVLLKLRKNNRPMQAKGLQVVRADRSYTIREEREIVNGSFTFDVTDEEYQLLKKIRELPDVVYLKGQADFAMGIVTGDNHRFLRDRNENGSRAGEEDPWEMVIRGSELGPYQIQEPAQEICYQRNLLQQLASDTFYRAPEKLLYRFIADAPVVAWDDQKRLTMNSCNLLIPRIPEIDMKYVMAVLNSRISRFYFRKSFRTMKVLRSHLEQMPIPTADAELRSRVVCLAEQLMQAEDTGSRKHLEEKMEVYMRGIFRITEEEDHLIRNSL